MKYYCLEEDMPREEITREQAAELLGYMPERNGSYFFGGGVVLVEGAPQQEAHQKEPERFSDFNGDFMSLLKSEAVPAGYSIVGYQITRIDGEGLCFDAGGIPAHAIRVGTAEWRAELGLYCVTAIKQQQPNHVTATGGCVGCMRHTCPRRGNGIKCRNYRVS